MNTSMSHGYPMVVEEGGFFSKVYGWMALALGITALVSFWILSHPESMIFLIQNRMLFYGLLIGELVLVSWLSIAINRLAMGTAFLMFVVYSALNGVTISLILYAFTRESIYSTFFVTAGTFGLMSIYGYLTKRDLTTVGNLAFMGLIGIILGSLVNFFLRSTALYFITTYVGILIFVALTAYDTQKIKRLAAHYQGTEADSKLALMGALALYLDFINLFLLLLRVMGRRK